MNEAYHAQYTLPVKNICVIPVLQPFMLWTYKYTKYKLLILTKYLSFCIKWSKFYWQGLHCIDVRRVSFISIQIEPDPPRTCPFITFMYWDTSFQQKRVYGSKFPQIIHEPWSILKKKNLCCLITGYGSIFSRTMCVSSRYKCFPWKVTFPEKWQPLKVTFPGDTVVVV